MEWPVRRLLLQILPIGLSVTPAGRTIPVKITSTSNITLGAWLTLAGPYYYNDLLRSNTDSGPYAIGQSESWKPATAKISDAVTRYPTILMFHGNAATRAIPFRVNLQRQYADYMKSNVLMIDYRGFADSDGIPSQRGLIDDAWASWNWLIDYGAKDRDVSVLGSSLGTAVGECSPRR